MRLDCEIRLPMCMGVLLLTVALDAIAQGYPTRPLRVVVPFPPGGAVDLYAGLMQKRLSETLGQQIVIDKRSCADGMIGAELVAKAPTDGYTLMFGNIATLAMNVGVYPKMAYHPVKDFTPIIQTVVVNYVLTVNPKVPAKNVEQLIAHAKANPGRLSYASPGSGSAPHFAVELLKSRTGMNVVHVPYKGGGPALADVIAGQVQLAVFDQGNAMPHAKAGRLRALGVGSTKRSPQYPELPTIAESDLPGYEAGAWQGLMP